MGFSSGVSGDVAVNSGSGTVSDSSAIGGDTGGNVSSDVSVVITCFNQGDVITDTLDSVRRQTRHVARTIIVDDGSTDPATLRLLHDMEHAPRLPEEATPAPLLTVIHQTNGGVSAARNTGLSAVTTPFAVVLDGDDQLAPDFIEVVLPRFSDASVVAASSWLQTFGVLSTVVAPSGGILTDFLPRNCCPATAMLRMSAWKECGGYDDSMRQGFEDWDFSLRLLETTPQKSASPNRIDIVKRPLIRYRTAPASSNITSMEHRLELLSTLIENHLPSYQRNVKAALIGLERISMGRLTALEKLTAQTLSTQTPDAQALDAQTPSAHTPSTQTHYALLENPSFGDGGMAAAVRLASATRQ